jgi:glycosyltransferase involved in cell wall biosynthesis
LNAHTGSTHSLAVASALGQKVAVVRTRSDARRVRKTVGSGFLFKHTHRIIAAADYINEEYVKTLKLPSKKIVTVYQGVSLEDFRVEAVPERPIIGIVARLDPVKGHRYLLEAVALLKNVYPELRVKVAGQEENVKQRDLEHMAGRLGISKRVEFLGYQKSVADVMGRCTIGVIASTGSEAVSRVALEWMAAGRPLVATRVGCLPEIVKEPHTGVLVEPRNAPELARAIGKLLHQPELLRTIGEAGRDRAENHFSLKKFAERTLSVYEAAAKEAGCLN